MHMDHLRSSGLPVRNPSPKVTNRVILERAKPTQSQLNVTNVHTRFPKNFPSCAPVPKIVSRNFI